MKLIILSMALMATTATACGVNNAYKDCVTDEILEGTRSKDMCRALSNVVTRCVPMTYCNFDYSGKKTLVEVLFHVINNGQYDFTGCQLLTEYGIDKDDQTPAGEILGCSATEFKKQTNVMHVCINGAVNRLKKRKSEGWALQANLCKYLDYGFHTCNKLMKKCMENEQEWLSEQDGFLHALTKMVHDMHISINLNLCDLKVDPWGSVNNVLDNHID